LYPPPTTILPSSCTIALTSTTRVWSSLVSVVTPSPPPNVVSVERPR
jgi:hypothetical protein